MPKNLYKTTLVIWSEFDGTSIEIDALAHEAMRGDAYCSKSESKLIEDPTKDPDWEDTEFFDLPEEREEPNGQGTEGNQ